MGGGWGGGGEQYQCSDELKNFCTKRLKFDDTFIILEVTANEVGEYVSSVGSKQSSGCDGISDKITLLSLPYIVQHLTYVCRGVGWGVEGKQVGSMNEEPQVRGCYNITFICTTPTNQETVSVLKKTQAKKKFRTWKQM